MGNAISDQIKEHGYHYLSLKNDNLVVGRSWEMAASKALNDVNGVFSGTLDYTKTGDFMYGHVPEINLKRTLYPNLITAHNR